MNVVEGTRKVLKLFFFISLHKLDKIEGIKQSSEATAVSLSFLLKGQKAGICAG